jgi:hypothetical protein
VLAGAAAWCIEVFGHAISDYERFLRGHLGGAFGGVVGGVTIAVPTMLVWMAAVITLDRWFGVRCPHCHGSLTLRCLHRQVAESGVCSLCHEKVLDET